MRLRHALSHGRKLCRSAWKSIRTAWYQRQFVGIRRTTRDRCWCGGHLLPFALHASYGVCAECGTFVNRYPPVADELGQLYTLERYWHARQRLKGHPSIEVRPANDRSDGRVDYWLQLIERYAPGSTTALEVGCGSGVLLSELAARGYSCVGVEPDPKVAAWVARHTGVDIRAGFFPDVDVPAGNDLFLAFDVLEHSPDPGAFLRGAAAALRPGGMAIIQTPVDRGELDPPFGGHFRAAFDDLEHLFVFGSGAAAALAEVSGLSLVSADEAWRVGHEVMVFVRP